MNNEFLLLALAKVADDLTSGYSDNFDRRIADVLKRIAVETAKLEKAHEDQMDRDWQESRNPWGQD